MNFPNTHPLSRPASVIGQADVVIGMELSDYWGTVNGFWIMATTAGGTTSAKSSRERS